MRICVRVLFSAMSAVLTLTFLGCGSGSSITPAPATSLARTAQPLVAQYNVSHLDYGLSAWVEFGTDTNYGRQTSVISSSNGLAIHNVSILVAGMKPQTTYHMRAHASWPSGSWVDQDRTFTTGAIPSSLLLPQFTVAQPTPPSGPSAGGIELLSMVSSLGTYLSAVATDLQGNVIWYCPGSAVPVKPMANGHYLLNSGTDWTEVDLACNVYRDVSISQESQALQAAGYSFGPINAFHHDMLVLPNGHWILLANVYKAFTDLPGYPGTLNVLGDILMDIDQNGSVDWAWSSFDQIGNGLDINRALQGLPDWTHSNCLVYTVDGNLLLSMRNQSWVLKIDYSNGTGSGNILWRLGDGGDFTLMGGDPAQWFYGQHYPNILSTNGSQTTLAIFDDGNLRIDSSQVACGSNPTAPACYSRATIYQIDESTMLANLLWDDVPGYYTNWGGSIDVLSNNDVEFNASNPFNTAASLIEEVTQTGSPEVVWQMTITGEAAYRGYRIPSLYPGVTWQQ